MSHARLCPVRRHSGGSDEAFLVAERVEDESGVGGVGLMAEGGVFSNGWCALTRPMGLKSVAIYQASKRWKPSAATMENGDRHRGRDRSPDVKRLSPDPSR